MKIAESVSQIEKLIEENRDTYINLSDTIWGLAETRFEEYQSFDLLAGTLEKEGFNVERGVGGIETAFIATYGQGKPVIALLGEYDALPGLSQHAKTALPNPVVPNGNGHGCGHNLLGTAPLAAAITLKKQMEAEGVKGTIKYYGCPGEEGGSGKTFMIREGLFEDADCALTWHPGSYSGIFSFSSLANYQIAFTFKGKASHAANSPHLGRSALDAVELMNVGVNYLREHIIPEARVHYAITNTGGLSPNVVQPEAEVLYLIRGPQMSDVKSIYNRVLNIAKGAALMTETEVDVRFDKACSNYLPNTSLGSIMHKQLEIYGIPDYDQNEMKFAEEIHQQITADDIQNTIQEINKLTPNSRLKTVNSTFLEAVLPFEETTELMFGSTDVGDVSWTVPTAQFFGSCFVFGTPLHTWQLVSQGATSLAHKGMLQAAKVLAGTAWEILQDPEIVKQAKDELDSQTEGQTYDCPIPEGVTPSPL
ncbi:aminobenzoyl-glutamate utilization protein B [Fictibacillus solisalsi]|uniref:Aminobenzoyl-glutamate utilization protein B n=1 Tax=Fictibacillus solisalsi TaxID=459525 RepID=A0A1G9ZY88_9BACL|nr:M20 family metallopeptidase [Fictibacillus solisalsi]SDN26248.1 aminobenzoyl-glutamate utilization protein B [Fictibacillus solisalsi]